MWGANEKARLDPRLMDKQAPAQPRAAAHTMSLGDEELPVYPIDLSKDNGKGAETGMGEGKGVGIKKGAEGGEADPARGSTMGETVVPVRSNLQLREIKEMKFRQEGFEAVVKAELRHKGAAAEGARAAQAGSRGSGDCARARIHMEKKRGFAGEITTSGRVRIPPSAPNSSRAHA